MNDQDEEKLQNKRPGRKQSIDSITTMAPEEKGVVGKDIDAKICVERRKARYLRLLERLTDRRLPS